MSTVDCSYYVLSSLVYSTCRVEGIRLVHLVQCTIIIDDVGLRLLFVVGFLHRHRRTHF
jgi:hypothetical protein